jgi:hypothetical protein
MTAAQAKQRVKDYRKETYSRVQNHIMLAATQGETTIFHDIPDDPDTMTEVLQKLEAEGFNAYLRKEPGRCGTSGNLVVRWLT